MGTTAATGSPLRITTVGLPFSARVSTSARWARTSRTVILLSSLIISVYLDLCTQALGLNPGPPVAPGPEWQCEAGAACAFSEDCAPAAASAAALLHRRSRSPSP